MDDHFGQAWSSTIFWFLSQFLIRAFLQLTVIAKCKYLWICLACASFLASSSLYYMVFECQSLQLLCPRPCQGILTDFAALNWFWLLGHEQDVFGTPVYQGPAVSHSVSTAHPVTQGKVICGGVFDSAWLSLSVAQTTQAPASATSARCIANEVPERVSTEMVFQMAVLLIPKFDRFASITSSSHEAFCFRLFCLCFCGAAWPTSCWEALKCGFALFQFLLGELGR